MKRFSEIFDSSMSNSRAAACSNPFHLLLRKPSRFHAFRSSNQMNSHKILTYRRVKTRASNSFNDHLAVFKPAGGGIIESDKLPSDVRNRTMDAVDACGGRVTMGDVSSKAGIMLSEAQNALQALAADANGFLEVSDEGDVLYVFPTDYRSCLANKSLWLRMLPFVDQAKSAAAHLVVFSLGATLMASILLVCTAITVIVVLACVSGEGDCGGFGSFFGTDWICLLDSYPSFASKTKTKTKTCPDMETNLFERISSFLIGDADPNQGIEEERWRLIGQYIVSNGGVLAAEELAPYLDVETAEKMADDSYILPVLSRFDGQPDVDGEGNILYVFPSLQRTADPNEIREWADGAGGTEKFLVEREWRFSKTSILERTVVIGLGVFNLIAVGFLGVLSKSTTVAPNKFISFMSGIFPLLQIYAASFFVVPLVRWLLVLKTNAEIRKRNCARKARAVELESPDLWLRMKLQSAREMSQRTFISHDRILYSTEKDLVEQDYEIREWDERFHVNEQSD